LKTETVYRCSPEDLRRVPEHKRLSAAPPGAGLPIGNLTSQFFANVYLNELDQFVKHQVKCRHYLRYVDDFVLLHRDPAQLRNWEQAIGVFLAERLGLELKGEGILRPVTDGADFLGYIVRPHYRLVRRRVVGNLRSRLAAFEQAHVGGATIRLAPGPRDALRATLASYLGHFAHAHSYHLVQWLFERYPWLGHLFAVAGGQLRPRWEPAGVTSLRSQLAYFRRAFPPAVALVQLGNRVALFGADLQATLARAPWLARWGDARPEQRPGVGAGLSWPLAHIKGLGRSLRHAGVAYAFVGEEGHLPGGMKRRVLRYLFLGVAPQSGVRVRARLALR
jgi:RNA-directed DNA polymerase